MKNIRFQLIPARGRKHFHLSIEIMMCIISTYPRKGTETALVNHLVPEVLDFNLSPQGDGNGTQTESLMIDLIFQLIPARGRKPLLHPVRAAGLNNFNLSPQNPLRRCAPALPKGELFQLPLPCTKLPLSGELARRKPWLRGFSPQGDGNWSFYGQSHWLHISTYPRKGAKNSASKKDAEFFFCVP